MEQNTDNYDIVEKIVLDSPADWWSLDSGKNVHIKSLVCHSCFTTGPKKLELPSNVLSIESIFLMCDGVTITNVLNALTARPEITCQVNQFYIETKCDEPTIPWLKPFPNLKQIRLNCNHVRANTLRFISKHYGETLQHLAIVHDKNISSHDLIGLARTCPNLRYVNFCGSSIDDDTLINMVKHCKQLTKFRLDDTGITEQFVLFLMSYRRYIDLLSITVCSNIPNVSLDALTDYDKLNELVVTDRVFTPSAFRKLCHKAARIRRLGGWSMFWMK